MRRFFLLLVVLPFLPWKAYAEPVVIGGVTYDHVDEGKTFLKAPTSGQPWEMPKPYRQERRAGMMAFITADPGEYTPDRRPKTEEHCKRLYAFLSQGETTCFWVGVHALKDLRGLRLDVDLDDVPLAAEARHMHCWPQRTAWNSTRWYMTPELLLPFGDGKRTVPVREGLLAEEAFDLNAGQTVGFWITLRAQTTSLDRIYRGTLSVRGRDERPLELPLEVQLLPILLRRPEEKRWLLYCDASRWRPMSEGQVLDELKDFAEHGFDGLVHAPFGTIDMSRFQEGVVRFDSTPFREIVALCKRAGLEGPHVCSMGGVPAKVKSALGISCDLNNDVWPEELRRGVKAVAEAVVEGTEDIDATWYFYGVDEPTGDNTYAIQEYQCWHDGGALTYATFFQIEFLERASAYLTAPCFVSGLVSDEERAQVARETCERTGAEFWWYGTGCYVNPSPQECLMFPNRYGAGLFFWKTGAKVQVTWTFCRPHGDVFNDFDGTPQNRMEPKEQATVYPHLLRANDWSTYQGAIPTIAWESLREGFNDYLYLETLTCAIEQARATGDETQREMANKAEKVMNSIVESVPWQNPMSRPAHYDVALTAQKLREVRRSVADQILFLQESIW